MYDILDTISDTIDLKFLASDGSNFLGSGKCGFRKVGNMACPF